MLSSTIFNVIYLIIETFFNNCVCDSSQEKTWTFHLLDAKPEAFLAGRKYSIVINPQCPAWPSTHVRNLWPRHCYMYTYRRPYLQSYTYSYILFAHKRIAAFAWNDPSHMNVELQGRSVKVNSNLSKLCSFFFFLSKALRATWSLLHEVSDSSNIL